MYLVPWVAVFMLIWLYFAGDGAFLVLSFGSKASIIPVGMFVPSDL
jgi:hypothetical protein